MPFCSVNDEETMRRFTGIFIGFLLFAVAMSFSPSTVEGQFATNTPSGSNNNGGFQAPTDNNGGSISNGFSFATNTPDGPTSTPTNTATATSTATNTPTATYTPSDTPSPTARPPLPL